MTDKKPDNRLEVLNQRPVSAWPYPRILTGVLQERAMSHASYLFYDFWDIAMQGVPIIKMPYIRTELARNKMAIQLLLSDYTHLLMLDIDHRHPIEIIQRLARWVLLKPEVQVVGGLNFRRGAPFDPCVGYWADEEKDDTLARPVAWERGLMPIDMLGTGSILIAREVFELIPPPWFAFDYSFVWADKWPGEDIWFSKLCDEYGVKKYVDTTCTSPHMTVAMINEDTYMAELEKDKEVSTTDDELVVRTKQQA